jgi:polyisoprenoid-binding protein YceI
MRKTHTFIALAAMGVLILPAVAKAQTYSFNVPSKLVNIAFESRMDVEDILGTTHKVAGYVKRSSSGKITFSVKVPVSTLRTGIAMRDKHLQGAMWLNAARNPNITFKGTSAKKLKKGRYRVWGTLTMRGISRPMSVDLRVRQIPSSVASRAGLGKGNWLRVRGRFTVKLSAHGIKIPGMAAAKVNDRWTVKVSLFARQVP